MQEKRRPGRPTDNLKKTTILNCARNLFLQKGPEVTLDEIAAFSGVAKATLYAKFKDKQALIEAVIRRESALTITEEEFIRLKEIPISEALYDFGVQYLRFINNRDLLNWDRLIASLESDNTDLPKHFFALGPGRGQKLLTRLIENAIVNKELPVCESTQAADILTGMWLGFVNLEIKLGAREPLTHSEIDERVEQGIRNFYKIYRISD
ncbi:TetR/AcrR family transcriptional regulator [Psychrobacter aestuarii]|uniref:TetR/AcrR family transcriptional regulator n=1 Tax=Psychrobacter aestuarii TaxID=556327 RepID=A0ABN0W4I7_9GAMM|nr:TetR/AcrR family transcriptional regulator [Psychrobacter aestuarii]